MAINRSEQRAQYDYVHTQPNRVMVTSGGLDRFATKWPCSGMRFDRDIAVEFEYDLRHGELVNIQWFDCTGDCGIDISEPEGVNGEALLALSQDAYKYGVEPGQNVTNGYAEVR